MISLFQKSGAVLAAILVVASSGASIAFAKEAKTTDQKAAHAAKVEKKALTATAVTAKQDKKTTTKTTKTSGDLGSGSALQQAIKSGNATEIKRVAQAMISTRIQALGDLKTEINNFKHLSDSDRSSLNAKIQSNLDAMVALRAKIGNEDNLSQLINEAKSITGEYQIGILANPQVKKMAVADRIESVLSVYQDLVPKLQTRINDLNGLSATGDKSRAQAALDDMKAKLNQADNLAVAAESLVSDLKFADDKASKDANAKVFAQAKVKLQAAHDGLKAARADLDTIQKILKGKR